MKRYLFKLKLSLKIFSINYFWRIYAWRSRVNCSKGKHFFVGIWKTDEGFCLYCDKTLDRTNP